MGWEPVITSLSFFVFHFWLESGKANRLRAAWAMDKKGVQVVASMAAGARSLGVLLDKAHMEMVGER